MRRGRIRLSRRAKTVRNLLLAALALLLWRGCLGFPSFTAMGAFRQCERRNMVGPAQVMGSLRIRNNRETLILARDGEVLEAVEVSRRGFLNWEAYWMERTPLDGSVQAIPLIWEDNQHSVLLFAVAAPPEARQAEGTMIYDPDGLNIALDFSGDQRMGDFIIARGQIELEDEASFMAFDFMRLNRREGPTAKLRVSLDVK